METLFNFSGINLSKLSKKEKFLFESYMLVCLHHELSEKFKSHHKKNIELIKYDSTMEDAMLDVNFLIYVVKDILSTEEYSLAGIANYTQIPEDVIYDLFAGINKNPSSILWKKMITLHSTVRRDLYRELVKKVIYNTVALT